MKRVDGVRWNLWLPFVAGVMAALMLGLAGLAVRAMQERNALVLDGLVLGLVHEAERNIRDLGTGASEQVLSDLLREAGTTIKWIILEDSTGGRLVSIGEVGSSSQKRRMDLFLGRGEGGPGPPSPGSRRGRGRFVLEVGLDEGAGALPLVARGILPTAAVVGLTLVALAFLGGNLLVRQRILALQVAQRSRMEALSRAGAGLAHQLRNPLATIKGSCQLVAEDMNEGPETRRLAVAISEVGRMEHMLGLLLDYARPPGAEPRELLLEVLIRDICEHYGEDVVCGELGHDVNASVDPDHFGEILRNLLDNAIAFSPPDQRVEVQLSASGRQRRVVVRDRGPGPGEKPDELFEPYFTTRADGAGLGLAIARNLAQANGGDVILQQRDGGGCNAVLTLCAGGGRE